MDNRTQREADAYDSGEVFENSWKLQNRFWHVFKCPNTIELENYFEKVIEENSTNSSVLDYGCLYGDNVTNLLKYNPSKIVGIDISKVAISKAKEKYSELADFYVMDAHKTDFENNTFDLIAGRSILHHLDWAVAIREINRILKPGGVACFIEPLGDNPAAKVIRTLTPKARTVDEKPLSKSQIVFADKVLGNHHHRFGNLLSVPIAMFTSLTMNDPNNFLLQLASKTDRLLEQTFIKYWMRTVVLVWKKAT